MNYFSVTNKLLGLLVPRHLQVEVLHHLIPGLLLVDLVMAMEKVEAIITEVKEVLIQGVKVVTEEVGPLNRVLKGTVE